MTGGTFTITNVGVFGVDTGTPIINPGRGGDPGARLDQGRALGGGRRSSRSARSASWRCPSTTGWSTGSRARSSWPTSVRCWPTPGWRWPSRAVLTKEGPPVSTGTALRNPAMQEWVFSAVRWLPLELRLIEHP